MAHDLLHHLQNHCWPPLLVVAEGTLWPHSSISRTSSAKETPTLYPRVLGHMITVLGTHDYIALQARNGCFACRALALSHKAVRSQIRDRMKRCMRAHATDWKTGLLMDNLLDVVSL